MTTASPRIAVVIPAFRVRDRVLEVIAGIGDLASAIYVVDDGCPEGSGRHVEAHVTDGRVRVIWHDRNRGVGAAVMTGYQAALDAGASVIVKIDGDGQMDPADLPRLVAPILDGTADYVKGNRFYNLTRLHRMPVVRIVGNAALSFITKFSSGYWDIFDPTNGYTAIHAAVARELPWSRMAPGYFFESDMLHHLGLLGAVVRDVPQDARYGDEKSGVRVLRAVLRFSVQHAANTLRRLLYNYFLRDFSAASVELVLGVALLAFGFVFGATQWVEWTSRGVGAYAGTVMLAALPIIVGSQLVLAFLSFDVARVPREPIHPQLERRRRVEAAITRPPAGSVRQ
ncbi:MAG TPA: glycosyltransferase family 2 protein [Vicinamibacterales bacterium]|nr:glycosyltransferase family 2 protein [Vicinamibacterales bacterium]